MGAPIGPRRIARTGTPTPQKISGGPRRAAGHVRHAIVSVRGNTAASIKRSALKISYNGSGTFVINTAGQPVVPGTTITTTAFNAFTADIATGLSTAITKDGQTTPTANIPMGGFKLTGLGNGTASTDAVNLSQIQTFGVPGYTTTATAAGTTTLTVASTIQQFFTGSTTQTVVLPVTSTLVLGFQFIITNTSSGVVTVNSSGGNLVVAMVPLSRVTITCILTSGTSAASWDIQYTGKSAVTGTGSMVLATSPTLVTPTLGVASATSINKVALTAPATGATLTVADGKTLTANNSLTFAGTDSTTLTFQGTGTVVNRDSTDTLTNKTIDGSQLVANSVANSKLAQMNASTIKGNNTGGAANAADLTVAQTLSLLGAVSTIAIKTITRDMSVASGSVAYTGVGFTPKFMLVFGGSNTASDYLLYFGVVNPARTGRCNAQYTTAGSATQQSNFIRVFNSGGEGQQADVSSYDADGFTLSWTKNGTPTGTPTFYVVCFG